MVYYGSICAITLYGILLLFLSIACDPGTEVAFNSMSDSTQRIIVKYANHFTVEYHENYKIVTTTASLKNWWNERSEDDVRVMVLVRKNTPIPALTGKLKNAVVIFIPVQSVAVNVQSGESFLESLELSQRLVACGGYISYNDSIRDKIKTGAISRMDYRWRDAPSLNTIKDRNAGIFFMRLSYLDDVKIIEHCRLLNIPTAPDVSWAEEDYMGRAEWIKYYALFFNEERQANNVFSRVEQNVDSIKMKVSKIPERSSAIWVYYSGGDRWVAHRNSIEARQMEDAGINNLLKNTDTSAEKKKDILSYDEVVRCGRKAKIWIIGDINSIILPQDKMYSVFDAWKTNRLYHTLKRYKPEPEAFDWPGMSVVRPDWVLADLVKIAYPAITISYDTRFIGRFDKEKIILPHQGRNSRVMGRDKFILPQKAPLKQ